ncbi:NUDIX domain-containing protein [uncultured Odoribacter sp.]|uniref:NUDIX domain-containing protein n=1 Tax=uncultured Odoribacter sp. TaxID=876416 RepID=UPI002583AFBA|nr:NUDIX domain-containing protein [uncultured Odoribacter sp.]
METSENIKSYYQDYISINKDETDRLKQFKTFIDKTESDQLFDRKNFVGHITGSAIIFDYKNSKVLLIKHIILQRWLQPGGHIEKTDASILDGVYREIFEETNIAKDDLMLISPIFGKKFPIDIDSHPIPENPAKHEKQHFHHDLRYFFIYKGEKITEESENLKWSDVSSLSSQVTFLKLVKKIWDLLDIDLNTRLFYENIISKARTTGENYIAVVVSHIIPDAVHYLRAIDTIVPIQTIVPKPNSIDEKTYTIVRKDFKISHVCREDMAQDTENEVIRILENTNEKILLFDIGGYFAHIHETWPVTILERIALIIEDTENGYQKYEHVIGDSERKKQNYPFKVVSVARSPLKENEDFLVGQAVFFSADALMREDGKLIQYLKCGILGYGKIGRSIASHLLQRGVKPAVYDTNPLKRVSAFNELNRIPDRDSIIKESDILFSATGNKSLKIEDFRELKNGCYIFSVTSSDDELELEFTGEYEKQEVRKHIFKYSNENMNYFFLVNDGNAVNFIYNAVMGDFIHLVRAEMILAINGLPGYAPGKISTVPTDIRENIAESWLKVFEP